MHGKCIGKWDFYDIVLHYQTCQTSANYFRLFCLVLGHSCESSRSGLIFKSTTVNPTVNDSVCVICKASYLASKLIVVTAIVHSIVYDQSQQLRRLKTSKTNNWYRCHSGCNYVFSYICIMIRHSLMGLYI